MPTFIGTQFPIARFSAEAYKERKANNREELSQTGNPLHCSLSPHTVQKNTP
ncbi:MAG: hypothetical protein NTW21_17505 [Verrucomicrobia bacterium]|nr:hypothetical protein [Verrucomicrobiota bacterium]